MRGQAGRDLVRVVPAPHDLPFVVVEKFHKPG